MKKIIILLFMLTPFIHSQSPKLLESIQLPESKGDYHVDIISSTNKDNPGFRLSELDTWAWNWGVWVVEFKIHHEYNDKNLLFERLEKKYINDQWEDWHKTTFIYDASDQLIIQIFQFDNQGVWENLTRVVRTYDENGNMIEEVYYTWDDLGGMWINDSKSIIGFDEYNRSIYHQTLRWENNEWKYLSQQLLTYNEQDQLVEDIYHDWDGVAWVNSSKSELTYDYKHRLLQRQSYSWLGGQWTNAYKGDYLYGINDELSTYTGQIWNGTEWENNRRNVYEWADENQTRLLKQSWRSNQWVNLSEDNYEYDSFNNKLEHIRRNWENNDWENLFRYQYSWERITKVEDREISIISDYELHQNYPNPFNPTTTINYSTPSQSHVSLKVFDVLGREIVTLVNKEQPVGNYEVKFDASELTSGIYFYRIQAGQFVESKKMILLK